MGKVRERQSSGAVRQGMMAGPPTLKMPRCSLRHTARMVRTMSSRARTATWG